MDRIEKVREIIDELLLTMTDYEERRCAYLHLYGKGSEMARSILDALQIFNVDEIDLICSAIYNHSDKSLIHSSLDEILKDADVLQHVMYNPLCGIKQQEERRYNSLKKELNLES